MMNSDENVKKIARFLENGGTMLANHCENCSAPLFRFKGEIICPICSGVEAVPASKGFSVSVSAEKSKQKGDRTEKKKSPETPKAVFANSNEQRLFELILQKITEVAEDMQKETDPRRISESLTVIEKGLELMNRLF